MYNEAEVVSHNIRTLGSEKDGCQRLLTPYHSTGCRLSAAEIAPVHSPLHTDFVVYKAVCGGLHEHTGFVEEAISR